MAGWYMVLIAKRSVVVPIGGHSLHHLEGTDVLLMVHNDKADSLVEVLE